MFTTFAKSNRGFIHIFASEQGCITSEKLGHKQKTIQLLFTNKQKREKVLFALESGAIEGTITHRV